MTHLAPVVIEGHDNVATNLGILAKVLEPQEAPANFHNVAVNNSTVHFGTKTYIDHVTIKQIVNGGSESETINKGDDAVAVAAQKSKLSTWLGIEKVQERCGLSTGQCACGVLLCAALLVAAGALAAGRSTVSGSEQDKVLLTPSTLRLISRKEWLAQPPSGPLDPLDLPTSTVVITHTATENCTDQAACVFYVRTMQTFHMESRNWFDIGYNFLVGGDGAVYEGRGWDKVGAHTKGYNAHSIGIAFIGTFNDILPPERQLVAARLLISMGVATGKLSKDYKLFGHRQLIPTLSPGNALFAELQKWPHFARDFNTTIS